MEFAATGRWPDNSYLSFKRRKIMFTKRPFRIIFRYKMDRENGDRDLFQTHYWNVIMARESVYA